MASLLIRMALRAMGGGEVSHVSCGGLLVPRPSYPPREPYYFTEFYAWPQAFWQMLASQSRLNIFTCAPQWPSADVSNPISSFYTWAPHFEIKPSYIWFNYTQIFSVFRKWVNRWNHINIMTHWTSVIVILVCSPVSRFHIAVLIAKCPR